MLYGITLHYVSLFYAILYYARGSRRDLQVDRVGERLAGPGGLHREREGPGLLGSKHCSPAPDLELFKLIFPRVLFSGGVFFHGHRWECAARSSGRAANPQTRDPQTKCTEQTTKYTECTENPNPNKILARETPWRETLIVPRSSTRASGGGPRRSSAWRILYSGGFVIIWT